MIIVELNQSSAGHPALMGGNVCENEPTPAAAMGKLAIRSTPLRIAIGQ